MLSDRQKLNEMSREELLELSKLLTEETARQETAKIDDLYPATGPLSRKAYSKHMEFFAAGLTHMERAAIAGNRTGKTLLGTYEVTKHLTGDYPDWWEGRVFDRPTDWWAASDTAETTRDGIQLKFMGRHGYYGSGLIPKKLIIGEPTHRRGTSGAVDIVRVRHKSGGESNLQFKSYDQGRAKFQSTQKSGVLLDEEPPAPVYFECVTRVTATEIGQESGLILATFTPLQGMSAVVLMFINDETGERFMLTMGMNHVPHISEESKRKLLASFPPHERDARMEGIPQLGSGAIYPYPDADIVVPDFPIPDHWFQGYGMDVGWKRTSAGFHAVDRDHDVIYRIGEHYMGQAEPIIHATAIKARGEWLPGVIDPAARGRAQHDGQQLIEIYQKLGLNLTFAKNAVEAGIYEMQQRLSTGRYKVFASCRKFLDEKKLYRRDEKGKIVKENDHAMDDARYFVMSGASIARQRPQKPKVKVQNLGPQGPGGWMK